MLACGVARVVKEILDDFHSCNPLEASINSSLSDQVVASQVQALSCRVELLDVQIQNRHDDRTAVKLARDSSAIQASQAHQLKIDNEMLKRENHRLKSALAWPHNLLQKVQLVICVHH